MKKIQIALAMGDGRGPEMMRQGVRIVTEAARMDDIHIECVSTPMGWEACKLYGDTLPKESYDIATELGILYFGGVGTPELDRTLGKDKPWLKPEPRCLLTIRKLWKLLFNYRPAIYHKRFDHLVKMRPEAIPEQGIEQWWLRFGLQDSYFGNEDLAKYIPFWVRWRLGIKPKDKITGKEKRITNLGYYDRETLLKFFRHIFKFARQRDLPVISVDKANVLYHDDYWRKICHEVHDSEFSGIPLRDQYADSANALMFEPAKLHGVIPIGNLEGDFLSDGALAGRGGLGLMYSWALNEDTGRAMFESGAGTAADLPENVADPTGRTLAGANMLYHIGKINGWSTKGAEAIERAVDRTLQEGWRSANTVSPTDNPNQILGTKEMGDKILKNLSSV